MFAKNTILRGRARKSAWGPEPGARSIKSVLRGKAAWTTRAGRYELEPGQLLVLNDGEEYSIEVDALQPVETFCLFFAPGFVDDVAARTFGVPPARFRKNEEDVLPAAQ
jgi:hypothetical protein